MEIRIIINEDIDEEPPRASKSKDALALLRHTDLPISEIARRVGLCPQTVLRIQEVHGIGIERCRAVKIGNKYYRSRSDAARALIADGKSLSDVAKAVGMRYQTVYAVTRGAEKVVERRVKYRATELAKTCKLLEENY